MSSQLATSVPITIDMTTVPRFTLLNEEAFKAKHIHPENEIGGITHYAQYGDDFHISYNRTAKGTIILDIGGVKTIEWTYMDCRPVIAVYWSPMKGIHFTVSEGVETKNDEHNVPEPRVVLVNSWTGPWPVFTWSDELVDLNLPVPPKAHRERRRVTKDRAARRAMKLQKRRDSSARVVPICLSEPFTK